MVNKSKVLACVLAASFALSAAADDDEMKTETKGSGAPAALPADSTGKLPPSAKAPSASDHALRAKVRKRAPFWIDDSAHGAAIRLNKDGTFSSEAQGGGSVAGSWKTMKGELHIQWSDGGEKYSYPISGKGNEMLINGKKVQKGRYHIN